MASKTKMKVGPKDPPKNGLKPGEKKVPSEYKSLYEQGGIEAGSIKKMSPSDTTSGTWSKPGHRIDLDRSMKAIQGGRSVYQPAYIKLAPTKKVVAKKTEPVKPTPAKPEPVKPVAPKKVEEAPKERVAYRSQTIIDEKGNKTFKNVAYSKYQPGKGWVLTGTPLVIDKRKKN